MWHVTNTTCPLDVIGSRTWLKIKVCRFESDRGYNVCPCGGTVDTQDLKSCDHYDRMGSTPIRGTKIESI